MLSPTRNMAGNLRWTRSGLVWADFLLRGLPYGLRPLKDKRAVRALHQALLRGLPGESLLLGLCSGLDPAAVVERMLAGVDLADCPEWAAECEASLDSLDAIGPGQRLFWLSVPLGASGADQVLAPLRAGFATFKDILGLPHTAIDPAELGRRTAQASRVLDAIPSPFRPEPATPAQMVWLHEHTVNRGLYLDLDLPTPTSDDLTTTLLTPKAGAALSELLLDEGGQTDLDARSLRRWNPLARRYLKVRNADVEEASYQSMLVIADVPDGGMLFPGSEILGRIDECGLDVDWALRLAVRSSQAVAAQNQKALRNLNEQYTQRDGELSHGVNMLDRVAADLAEYVAVLESDKLEVEVQATVVFCVAAAQPNYAVVQAKALAAYMAQIGYKLTQPLGYQEDLWWAMQPGTPTSRVMREFAQITTSKNLAATVPLASNDLGDPKGSLLALNISNGPLQDLNTPCGPTSVILHDAEGSTDKDISGSLAIAGELGSGKALALDTPIPTPSGWTSMGNLTPGDQVLDDQGRSTVVVAVSPVMHGRRCYEVVFSDGSSIVADADHAWTTLPDRVRSRTAKHNHRIRHGGTGTLQDLHLAAEALTGDSWPEYGVTSTTEEIRSTLCRGAQANHAIPVAGPLDLPEADLPIDAYVLGCWLGDGSSNLAQLISADPELLTYVEAAGYVVTKLSSRWLYSISLPSQDIPSQPIDLGRACAFCGSPMRPRYRHQTYCSHRCAWDGRRTGQPPAQRGVCESCGRELLPNSTGRRCSGCWHASTLRGRLGLLGVLNNKHIPPRYLRASRRQRQALLAGLLDADGTVSPGGTVEICLTRYQLAADTYELACSLGYRARLRPGRALLNGRDCGPKWTVAFTTTDQVFRLSRKQRTHTARSTRSRGVRHRLRYIVDVREVPSVPVRCIRVAASTHLFLAGRAMIPTHNSVTLKKIGGDVVDRGGRVIAADRTAMGEYGLWARSVANAVVADVVNPQYSMDPLRLFAHTPAVASRITQSFLTPLLNITPTSDRGVLLSDVLDPGYLTGHNIGGSGTLLRHLLHDCELDGAADLGRLINVFGRRDLGRVIFDEALPLLPLTAGAIVIRTHTLELPSREELEIGHLFDQLKLEKIFGRAMYAFIAALARHICFSDLDTFGAFINDECHATTISPEGERELVDFVRDGRKHRAAVFLGSHDPEADFGSPTLRGLIPTRILMRHRDKTLAQRGLKWLDLDPTDEDLLNLVTKDMSPVLNDGVPEHRRGECLIRDSAGNVGRGKILAPAVASRSEAARTGGVRGTKPSGEAAGT